jgi:type IV pilus assembly protein PilW
MSRSRGFSLVEMMIAITMSLLVCAALVSVFVGSRSAFLATSGTAAVADGGRFALSFIENSVRSAGYMGCATAQTAGTAAGVAPAILNAGVTPLYDSFGQGLGGFEANNTGIGQSVSVPLASGAAPVTADTSAGDWVSGLDAALVGQVVKNNDVLVVRSTLRNAPTVYVNAIADGTSSFTVNDAGGLAVGDFAVISDCTKFAAFQVTSISGTDPSVVIGHAGGGSSPGNSTSSFPVSFYIGAQVTALDTIVYYIGRGADGDSALFSYDLNSTNTFTATELVPDIEAMQVLYGVDTTGSSTVGEYVTADQVATQAFGGLGFNGVMSVKVAVLAASAPGAVPVPSAAQTFNLLGTLVTAPLDTRKRQVFDITIGLRNLVP